VLTLSACDSRSHLLCESSSQAWAVSHAKLALAGPLEKCKS